MSLAVWQRFTVLGNVGDSVIVGLVAIRVLRGRVLSRVLNSIVMALVTFSVLTRSSKRASKTIEVEATEERLVALDETQSDPVDTKAVTIITEEIPRYDREAMPMASGHKPRVTAALMRPIRLVRSLISAVF